jgi:hypothetical protein
MKILYSNEGVSHPPSLVPSTFCNSNIPRLFLPKMLSSTLPRPWFSILVLHLSAILPLLSRSHSRGWGTLYSFSQTVALSNSFIQPSDNSILLRDIEMTVVSYHSTLISNFASQEEAADKTSSQIFLSRGVAGAEAGQAAPAPAPRSPSPTFVMSVFESESRHVMNLGNATAKAKSTVMVNDSTRAGQSRLHQDCVKGKHYVAFSVSNE